MGGESPWIGLGESKGGGTVLATAESNSFPLPPCNHAGKFLVMFLNVFVSLMPSSYVICVALPRVPVHPFLHGPLKGIFSFSVHLKPTSELKVKGSDAGFIAVQALRTKVSFILSFCVWYLPFDSFPRQSLVETVSCQSVETVGAGHLDCIFISAKESLYEAR